MNKKIFKNAIGLILVFIIIFSVSTFREIYLSIPPGKTITEEQFKNLSDKGNIEKIVCYEKYKLIYVFNDNTVYRLQGVYPDNTEQNVKQQISDKLKDIKPYAKIALYAIIVGGLIYVCVRNKETLLSVVKRSEKKENVNIITEENEPLYRIVRYSENSFTNFHNTSITSLMNTYRNYTPKDKLFFSKITGPEGIGKEFVLRYFANEIKKDIVFIGAEEILNLENKNFKYNDLRCDCKRKFILCINEFPFEQISFEESKTIKRLRTMISSGIIVVFLTSSCNYATNSMFANNIYLTLPDIITREKILCDNKEKKQNIDFRKVSKMITGADYDLTFEIAENIVPLLQQPDITTDNICKYINDNYIGKNNGIYTSKEKTDFSIYQTGRTLIPYLLNNKKTVISPSILQFYPMDITASQRHLLSTPYLIEKKVILEIRSILGGISAEKVFCDKIGELSQGDLIFCKKLLFSLTEKIIELEYTEPDIENIIIDGIKQNINLIESNKEQFLLLSKLIKEHEIIKKSRMEKLIVHYNSIKNKNIKSVVDDKKVYTKRPNSAKDNKKLKKAESISENLYSIQETTTQKIPKNNEKPVESSVPKTLNESANVNTDTQSKKSEIPRNISAEKTKELEKPIQTEKFNKKPEIPQMNINSKTKNNRPELKNPQSDKKNTPSVNDDKTDKLIKNIEFINNNTKQDTVERKANADYSSLFEKKDKQNKEKKERIPEPKEQPHSEIIDSLLEESESQKKNFNKKSKNDNREKKRDDKKEQKSADSKQEDNSSENQEKINEISQDNKIASMKAGSSSVSKTDKETLNDKLTTNTAAEITENKNEKSINAESNDPEDISDLFDMNMEIGLDMGFEMPEMGEIPGNIEEPAPPDEIELKINFDSINEIDKTTESKNVKETDDDENLDDETVDDETVDETDY